MDTSIAASLSHSQVVDITTTGRRSGAARRIEIFLHRLDDGLYISGMPRPQKRAWIANLEADPRMTLHLKASVQADLPATARVVTDEAERRRIMPKIARAWNRSDVDVMVRQSPLIEVIVDDAKEAASAA
jgi:deazaflavin-dependent oxidoreductase (nitroreductase family)